MRLTLAAAAVVLLFGYPAPAAAQLADKEVLFGYGTVGAWNGETLTEDSPSALVSMQEMERQKMPFFDGRWWDRPVVNAYRWNLLFDEGKTVPVIVHPLLGGASNREREVRLVAENLGRVPAVMRARLLTVYLDEGTGHPTTRPEHHVSYIPERSMDIWGNHGHLEEMILHETGHTSEAGFAESRCWAAAQESDPAVVSTYARDNPNREDFAETIGIYIPFRHWPELLPPADRKAIREGIPARIRCLDRWGFGTGRP